MKKLIAFAIAAIMVLSMIPAMAISTSAVEETDWSLYPEPSKDFWSVYRNPRGYEIDLNAGDTYTPAPGYKYTSEGFALLPADYTNMTPWFTVQTSQPVNLTDGFYMQFRIDEFAYKGENLAKPADEWICLSISDTRMMSPGSTSWNNNWLSLVRGAGDGSASFEAAVTTKDTDEVNGKFDFFGAVSGTVPKDGDGKEIYELEITYDGTNYDIKICGVSMMSLQGSKVQAALSSYEEAYVGITMQTGIKDSTAGLTILKQGTSKANATTPEGTDEADPEDNILVFGDPIDPSTVPANEPALLFDAHKTSFKKDPSGSNIHFTATANYTYHLAATADACYFTWGIKNDLTYMAEDFPVFAMMLKDYMGNDGSLYYSAGDILAASPSHVTGWSLYGDDSEFYGADEEYSLVVVDLSKLNIEGEEKQWTGRINGMRPDFSVDANDEEWAEWDVEYMGMFRSVEEAHAYAEKHLGDAATETKEEPGASTDEPDTNGQDTVADTADGKDTSAGDTETSASTNGSTKGETKAETKAETKEPGCASAIGMSTVAVLAAAAAVALKKKD